MDRPHAEKNMATFQARIGTDFPTIQADLGHSSPATTQNYLVSEDRRSPRRREQINAADALVLRNPTEATSNKRIPRANLGIRGNDYDNRPTQEQNPIHDPTSRRPTASVMRVEYSRLFAR